MPEHAWLDRRERAIAKLTAQLDVLSDALRFYCRSTSLALSPVPLAPLFWRLRHESYDDASRRGISIRAHPTQAHVESHPVLPAGILRNAVKYTDPGGRILIGCRRCGPDVRTDIHDTGIGLRLNLYRQSSMRLNASTPWAATG